MPGLFYHKSACLLLLIFSVTQCLVAQTSYHINTTREFDTDMITDITRDRNNNMWIGTYNGLYKHEGSRIRSFNKAGKDSTSLSGLEMHSVFEDKRGFIWVGTTNGLDKIDPYTYAIEHIKLKTNDSSSSFIGYIYSVFQDDEESIWVSTDAAIFKIDYKTRVYRIIPKEKNKTGIPVTAISYNSGIKTGKGIWMYTEAGMVYYEYSSRLFYHRYHNPQHKAIFDFNEHTQGQQSDMSLDKSGNIWFVANHRLLIRYDWKKNLLDSFAFERPAKAWFCCYSVKADTKNNVWVGMRHGGLLFFNSSTQKFTNIYHQPGNTLLSSNYIYSLEEDYQGNIWASSDNGIAVINYYKKGIRKNIVSDQADFINLTYQSGDITTDKHNNVFIPFYKYGFFRYNAVIDSTAAFTITNAPGKGATYVLPDSGITSLVWVARENKLAPVSTLNDRILNLSSTHLLPAAVEKYKGSIIWQYRENEKSVYVRKNSSVLLHFYEGGVDSLAAYGWRKNLALAADTNSLWYINASLNLVNRNFATRKQDTILLQQLLRQTDLSFSNPRDMVDDGKNVWITSQNGLLRYDQINRKVYGYSTDKGLAHSFSFALCLDKKKRLWVCSFGGISVYDRVKDRFVTVINFPTSSYMETFGSVVETAAGALVFHVGNDLFTINPDEIFTQKANVYQMAIHEVQVNGKALNWSSDQRMQKLDYRQNRILIRFGLLDFEDYSYFTYWYRLSGSDEKWISNNNLPEIQYNSLEPGNYRFQVKVTDVSGNELAPMLELPIKIKPPFWQTWWFRILLGAVLVTAVFFVFRSRLNAVRKKAAVQQQLAELEGKALRAQMNPHFIFNSLNAIQELIVMEKIDSAYEYLARFSRLLRMVLNNSEKNLVSLQEEIDMISIYLELESLRFKNSFSYNIEVDNDIETEEAEVPPLLLQPFIENAIWHGLRNKVGEKKLLIRCSANEKGLLCIITDNGIGREKASAIKASKMGAGVFASRGMILSAQRMQVMNLDKENKFNLEVEDLFDEAGRASGTRVILHLPQRIM